MKTGANHPTQEQAVPVYSRYYQLLGPGILFAATAIGVSHLVQSTRAGALYGLAMMPILLIACAAKYPSLLIGLMYPARTGKTLLQGYREQGWWAFAGGETRCSQSACPILLYVRSGREVVHRTDDVRTSPPAWQASPCTRRFKCWLVKNVTPRGRIPRRSSKCQSPLQTACHDFHRHAHLRHIRENSQDSMTKRIGPLCKPPSST